MENLPPVIITVAPNGARRTKADHPALPIGPDELAVCAQECMEAGASVIHLHVRDDQERHSLDVGRYQEAIDAIRSRVGDGMVIQVTTESVGKYSPSEQMEMVRKLQPEAVSLALRELVPHENDIAIFSKFTKWLDMKGIASQFILYDIVDVEFFGSLKERGVIQRPLDWVLFVLGKYQGGYEGNIKNLERFLKSWMALSSERSWGICAFGAEETDCALAAVRKGGHPRIGFENNLWHSKGALLKDNSESVFALSNALKRENRRVAVAHEARKAMGIA